jgi:hypothetical protein
METIIGIGLALPLGVWLGYKWRDRISQRHRVQYLTQRLREQREALERERTWASRPALVAAALSIWAFIIAT